MPDAFEREGEQKGMTDTDAIPKPKILTRKPLVEAIFELKWALPEQPPGFVQDPGAQLLLGSFYDRIKRQYPVALPLPTASAPPELTGHMVTYQFRVAKNKWPLVQLGPGILTVNDTEGYTWDSFRPRLIEAIQAIFDSYPGDGEKPHPVFAQLRYINAITFNPQETSVPKLLREKLHTDIEFDKRLFEQDQKKADSPAGLGLNVTYPLSEPRGVGGLFFAQGRRNDQDALVWEIVIRSVKADAPQAPSEYPSWLDSAHTVAERWFLTLCRGALHESFT